MGSLGPPSHPCLSQPHMSETNTLMYVTEIEWWFIMQQQLTDTVPTGNTSGKRKLTSSGIYDVLGVGLSTALCTVLSISLMVS